jgi:hypothetical protein
MKRIATVVLFGVALIASAACAQEYKVGDKIKVEWKGSWYPAVVKNYNAANKCWNIHYDNYSDSWDECVGKKRIKSK